ncbi:MAG: ectoine synthase [bacterium]|nr:ectoine synthase [bacterium]
MFVRTLNERRRAGAEKVLCEGRARSTRFLTIPDGMGFTMSDVRVADGMSSVLWYRHHWEANYIVAGRGTVRDLERDRSWPLAPGTLYTVGPKDRHLVDPDDDLHVVSVFNPPLAGDEAHDSDGSYPPTGPVPVGRERMFVRTVDDLVRQGRQLSVAGGSATTVRMLLRDDRVGFSLSDVRLAAGSRNVLWYRHHREANYVLDGTGEVTDLGSGETWKMEPGMMYCVGPEDRHSMHARSDLRLLSVFCPALTGDEQHDAEGTLAASGDALPPGPASGSERV